MACAAVFFVGLVFEYRYDLFPDKTTGAAEVLDQLGFATAMVGWVAALVLTLRARASAGARFVRIAMWLQATGLVVLVVASMTVLDSGNQDSVLLPIGGVAMLLGGLLTGVSLVVKGQLQGWNRAAAAGYAVFFPVFAAGGQPVFPVEVLWPTAWFVLGAALASDARRRLA